VWLNQTDLDGTLLNSTHKVTPRTAMAIKMAQNEGVKWMVASGRSPRSINKVVSTLGGVVPDMCICCNGGLIFDNRFEKVLVSENFSRKAAIQCITELEAAIPGCGYAVEVVSSTDTRFLCDKTWLDVRLQHMYYDYEAFPNALAICDALILQGNDSEAVHFVDGKRLEGANVGGNKLLLVHPNLTSAELFAKVPQSLLTSRDSPVTITYSNDFQLEISAQGVSKGNILRRFCDERGIHRREICAFGDFINDAELLSFAGMGVVMENGSEVAKREALYHTASNDEDGVAIFIEKLLHETGSKPKNGLRDRRGTM
jgi:Cof subfamily protein (haloacid dehalogenase superfamily)